jgi:hypothetical protein
MALAAGGGCELVVGDAVPAFACIPGPEPCPENEVCDLKTHHCVPPCTPVSCGAGMYCDPTLLVCAFSDASVNLTDAAAVEAAIEASGQRDATNVDVTPEGSPGDSSSADSGTCTSLTCACAGKANCASQICADMLTAGAGLYAKASQNFCTKPCCTSADCDGSTVCYATATGGSFCVLPEWLGRSTQLGTKTGGDTCANDSECRSGLCANMACADTCCSTAASAMQCARGTTCSVGLFPGVVTFDTGFVAYCGLGGSKPAGAQCSYPTDCASNLCDGSSCTNACRNTGECGNGMACMYGRTRDNTVVVAACFPQQGGTTAEGGNCKQDADCLTGFCNPMSKQCSDVCFADTDCTVPGWRCRPQYVTLRSGGMTSVMSCGT